MADMRTDAGRAYSKANKAVKGLLALCQSFPDYDDTNATEDEGPNGETIIDMQTIQRQRRVRAHPDVRVTRDPKDPQRQVIMVELQAQGKVSLGEDVLGSATAAARATYDDEEFEVQTHRVGAALSKFSNSAMRAVVGDALKPNSRYRYGTRFRRSKVKSLKDQISLLPQPVKTTMRHAVREFWQELNAMTSKDRRYALYRATSNAYKAMHTHQRRNIANINRAVKERRRKAGKMKAVEVPSASDSDMNEG